MPACYGDSVFVSMCSLVRVFVYHCRCFSTNAHIGGVILEGYYWLSLAWASSGPRVFLGNVVR